MNETFNLKRFLLLERYKRAETGKHLLWSGTIVLSICILCILYDINRGGSYYGKFTSADNLCQYILYFLFAAPCLLETNLSKHTATLDILLPASTFEKFMHIWIKYFLLFPIFCVSIGIVLLAASLMPDTSPEGYWLNNITAWPKTNYPLSATTQAIVTFCNYAAPICVVLGSWISSYFLLKEKQL